jgi:hypothetical protein
MKSGNQTQRPLSTQQRSDDGRLYRPSYNNSYDASKAVGKALAEEVAVIIGLE